MKNLIYNLLLNFLFVTAVGIAQEKMVLQSYDGSSIPVNGDGDTYPSYYDNQDIYSGVFSLSLNGNDAISGKSLQVHVTKGTMYAEFNPYNYAGSPGFSNPRGWAREYSQNPAQWKYNTYNRFRFWIKMPADPTNEIVTDGSANDNIGTYVKRISNPDYSSDEAGGDHWYHNVNFPRTGTWVQVVLNMHPDHSRGENGGLEQGDQSHPTNEAGYNYYDALTRFYIQVTGGSLTAPMNIFLDEFEFYKETNAENDDQVRSISSTYVPATNKIIVTWYRDKDSNDIKHEIRYSFSDIHASGWNAATLAPDGIITPPGWQGYNGMYYSTNKINLAGKNKIYIAIKPQGSSVFTQVTIPLIASDSSAPVIAINPQNITVAIGHTAIFMTSANGTTPITYQWQKNGVNISGATSTNYTTPATISGDNGAKFRCIVANSLGKDTSNEAILTVITSTPSIPTLSAPSNNT